MKKTFTLLAVSAAALATQVHASTLTYMPNNLVSNTANCTADSFVINQISETATGTPVTPPGFVKESTNCQRYRYVTNATGSTALNQLDNFVATNMPDPMANVGEAEDGFLNASNNLVSGANGNSVWTDFLTSDRLLDLNGDGNATDPGYIHIGTQGNDIDAAFSYTQVNSSPIDDIVTVDFTCASALSTECYTGGWTVSVDQDAITKTQALLGHASTFDQLVFTIRVGWNGDFGGLGVYSLDFANEIASGAVDDLTPYVFSGEWNTDDFYHQGSNYEQQALRIDVFARDPIDANAPGTIGIFLLGAAGLVARRMTKK